jgi:putative ABC transport system ATP-binding protein
MSIRHINSHNAAGVSRTPLVSLRSISLTYGAGATSLQALRDISLDVYPGEVLLLMGPSGSGKTSLLEILGCVLRPTSGEVQVEGRGLSDLDPTQLAQLRLGYFGFVFQNANLFPTLRAWENVAISLDLCGIRGPEVEDRSHRLLAEVGLAERAYSYPAQLSGGEKQRVGIARALAGEPRVILADEPTAALDSANAISTTSLLRSITQNQGRAVVIVTHDYRLITPGDRIVQVEDGLLIDAEVASSSHVWSPSPKPHAHARAIHDVHDSMEVRS